MNIQRIQQDLVFEVGQYNFKNKLLTNLFMAKSSTCEKNYSDHPNTCDLTKSAIGMQCLGTSVCFDSQRVQHYNMWLLSELLFRELQSFIQTRPK